jgi:hypothetical protein
MANSDRKFLRNLARKEFKKFKKENPQYRAMTFKSYYDLYKAGIVNRDMKMKQRSIGPTTQNAIAAEAEQEQSEELLRDILIEDLEEDETTST